MSEGRVSRRKYIAVAGAAAAAAVIGGAAYYLSRPGPPTPTPTPKPTATPTPKPVTGEVTWLHTGWGGDTAKKIVENFMKENPEIKVIYTTTKSEEYHSKMVAAFAGGSAPWDIIWCPLGWYYEFIENGWIIPIDDYLTNDLKNDLLPMARAGTEYEGSFYGLPWYLALGLGFFYNEKMLSEAGIDKPPGTWDEVLQQCLTLKEKGVVKYPLSMSLMEDEDTWTTFKGILKAHHGKFYDDDGKCLYNSPLAVEVLQWIVDCVHKHKVIHPTCLETEMHGVAELMAAGEVAFQINNYYYMKTPINDPEKSKVAGQVNTVLMPGPEGKPGQGGSIGSAPNWGIPKYTKNPEATYKFLSYLGGPIGNKRWAVEKSLFPAYKSAANDPEVLSAIKGAKVWLEQVSKYGVFQFDKNYDGPEKLFGQELAEVAMKEISKAVTLTKTPKEALDAIAKAYEEIKARLGK